MARQIQLRRGTAEQHEQFIGADGEVTVDTTNRTLRVHDGETPGGIVLARAGTTTTGMPGSTYIDMPIGVNGTTYTAPAAGYVYVQGLSTNASSALDIVVNNLYAVYQPAAYNSSTVRALVPVEPGATFCISWINVNINMFRFIYCA